MVLVEAQANGLPIISFDCPVGPREIIKNNVTGILVKNGDTELLATTIVRLATSPDQRQILSINALRSVKRFDVNEVVKKWEVLFEELINKNKV